MTSVKPSANIDNQRLLALLEHDGVTLVILGYANIETAISKLSDDAAIDGVRAAHDFYAAWPNGKNRPENFWSGIQGGAVMCLEKPISQLVLEDFPSHITWDFTRVGRILAAKFGPADVAYSVAKLPDRPDFSRVHFMTDIHKAAIESSSHEINLIEHLMISPEQRSLEDAYLAHGYSEQTEQTEPVFM